MPEMVKFPKYKVGDKVLFTYGEPRVCRIIGARGSYDKNRPVRYDIIIPMDPEPLRTSVREDQIELVTD